MKSNEGSNGTQDAASPSKRVPLVRYGHEKLQSVPEDKYGQKLAHCGNISHIEDQGRALRFPRFTKANLVFEDETAVDGLSDLLKRISADFLEGNFGDYAGVVVVRDDSVEKTVRFKCSSGNVRISQYRDVDYKQRETYYKAQRAVDLETKATARMQDIEPEMGKDLQNYSMALEIKRLDDDKAVTTTCGLKTRPTDNKKRRSWYKKLRTGVIRSFWLDNERNARDRIREASRHTESGIQSLITEIVNEDRSRVKDHFYQHFRDAAAAEDQTIYNRIDEDVFVILDRNGSLILCSVSNLFQKLFGVALLEKVTDATKQWAAIAPLPQPETSRHAVDELHRRNHPELDMELATTPKELEDRPMCVVHYGTWAQKGHSNPKVVFRTPDTMLKRGNTVRTRYDVTDMLFPRFKFGVLGICSERHRDSNDVKNGLASIVPLGNYTGGDFCFPQLVVKLSYQPGDCVVFRGAEIEHFVEDWRGYRIFVLCTNHQPIRNFASRVLGKAEALPTELWYRSVPPRDPSKGFEASDDATAGRSATMMSFTSDKTMHGVDSADSESDESNNGDDVSRYDPCFVHELDPEEVPEGGWTDADIHGMGTWSPRKNSPTYVTSSSTTMTSSSESNDHVPTTEPASVAVSDVQSQ